MRNEISWVAVATCCATAGCVSPRPPTLTPEVVSVAGVSAAGLELMVGLQVHNPNTFPITAREVQGTVWLADEHRLGTGRASPGQWIDAEGSARVQSELRIAWQDLSALRAFLGRPVVPYRFDGKVTLGGEHLNVDLPFELEGQLTAQQLLGAGLRGLPSIP